MHHLISRLSASALVLAILLAGCSSGGSGTKLITKAPAGTGTLAIDMTGSWEIVDVRLVESNAAVSLPPIAGSILEFSSDSVMRVSGQPVTRADLEAGYGRELDYYSNNVNGRFVMYGFKVTDATGGLFEGGFAGGVVSATRIEVESAWRARPTATDPEQSERYRYALVLRPAPAVLPESAGLGDLFPAALAIPRDRSDVPRVEDR